MADITPDDLFGAIKNSGRRAIDDGAELMEERVDAASKAAKRRKQKNTAFKDTSMGRLGSFGYITGSNAVFGLDVPMRGAMNVVGDVAKAAVGQGDFKDSAQYSGLGRAIKQSYDEGRRKQRIGEAQARDNLGWGAELGADVTAAFLPGGLPNKVAKTVESGRKGLNTLASRINTQGLVGTAESAIQNFVDGDLSLFDLPAGYASGAVGQAVLGEMAPALAKYGFSPENRAAYRVSNVLFDTGPNQYGINPDTIRAKYADMVENDTGLRNTQIGNTDPMDGAARITEALARAPLAKQNFAGDKPPQEVFDLYAASVKDVDNSIKQIQANAMAKVHNTLDKPLSDYSKKLSSDAQLQGYREKYEELYDTSVPGKRGATQISYRNTVDNLGKTLSDALDNTHITELDGIEARVWNEALGELRPKGQHKNTRTLARLKHDTKPEEGETINLRTATVNMKKLLDARKHIASTLKPGTLKDGTTVTKENVRAGVKMVEAIDDELARLTFDESDTARMGYAKFMRQRDANEMGHEFYAKRLLQDPDYGRDVQQYMDALRDDPDALEAFRVGFAQSMRAAMDGGAIKELKNLLGDVDVTTPDGLDDYLKGDSANLNMVRQVLGKDTADDLIRGVLDDANYLDVEKKLREVLLYKGHKPESIDDALRDGDNLLLVSAMAPNQNSILANASVAAAMRKAQTMTETDAALVQRLTSSRGQDAVNNLEDFLTRVERPSTYKIGGRLTQPMTDDEGAKIQNRAQQVKDNAASMSTFLHHLATGDAPSR